MSAPARSSQVAALRASILASRLPKFRRNLWLFLVAIALTCIGIGAQALVLNLYLVTIGFRDDFIGLFSFANTAGIGLAALLAGRASNKYGSRRTLIAAVLVLALSSAGLVASQNPIVILVVAVVNGAALAHIFVPSATYVMDNAQPDQRSTAYAGYFAAQSVAMVLGSFLGGALPTALAVSGNVTAAGYVWTLLASAALALLGVAPLCLADESRAVGSGDTVPRSASPSHDRRKMRRDMAWNVGASTLIAGSMGFALPFINVYFASQLGADTVQIGVIFAVASGAMVVASLAGPVISRRFGVIPTIVAFRLITVPMIVGLAFAPSLLVGSVLYVARTLMTNATWPADNTFSMELVSPNRRATLAALRSSSWNVAWAITSGLAGLMIVGLGFASIFVASGILMIVGCLVYFVAFRSEGSRDAGAVVADTAVGSTEPADALSR